MLPTVVAPDLPRLLADNAVNLRPPRQDDVDVLARWGGDPEFARYQWGSEPWTEAAQRAMRLIQQFAGLPPSQGRLLMIEIAGGTGTIGYVNYRDVRPKTRSCMAGIAVADLQYWSMGYGTRAMRLLLGYLFGALAMHKVALRMVAFNTLAIRGVEHCGFRREGLLRDNYWLDNRWWDCMLMAVLEDEWASQHQQGS